MDGRIGENYSHAYIIAAPPEEGFALAKRLAQGMLCSAPRGAARPCGVCRDCRKVREDVHPDVLVLTRQTDDKGKPRREIYVDQVRDLAATAPILPSEAERKAYILRDAGTMNPAAQNALLKLLEEPPAFDAFLLVADSADQLLETVRSRCVLLRENGEEPPPDPAIRDLAEHYLDLAAGRARLSLITFANDNGERPAAELREFTRAVRLLLADMLCARLPDRKLPRRELLRLSALMDQADEYLRFNVSPKHVLGMLAVKTLDNIVI